jgi:fructan beta-fructosidase
LVIDRKQSGLVEFHKDFAGRQTAPIRLADNRFKLRLLIDTSSLEAFAQNGETVMTDILFPAGKSRSISLTAGGDETPKVDEIMISPLRSAWTSQSAVPSKN